MKDDVVQSLAEMLPPVLNDFAPQFDAFANRLGQGWLQALPKTFASVRQAIVDTGIPAGLAQIATILAEQVLPALARSRQRNRSRTGFCRCSDWW